MLGKKEVPVILSQPVHEVTRNVNVTITEKRAPTDESVKLLRELESEAETRIAKKVIINLEDNSFEGAVFISLSPGDLSYEMKVMFKINGREYIKRATIREIDLTAAEDGAAKVLVEKISEAVTAELLKKTDFSFISRLG